MVVCKFFLQGNCRYGEMCKFEHQSDGNRSSHTSILRQQNFTPTPNTNTVGTNVDTNTLLQSVANDMASAERGGQWMLSCYTPFKEKACFPGFEDQSFEEVRWGFYEAQLNGTLGQYCQQLQALLQNVAMQMKLLQNPSPEIINTITSIYYSNSNSVASTNTNVFGQSANQNSSSIFAVANQQYFGAQPVQTNAAYGNTQSMFAHPINNVNPMQQQFQQPFQQPQQQTFTNTITNPPSNTNIFKVDNTQPSQNNSPLFNSNSSTQASIFGSNENTMIPFTQKPKVQDESAYSKLDDLSDEDIIQFQSDSFEFGKIPEKPPTAEMCF
ncbi:hypothetical protein RN001_014133 [Aquatica leii]|uniref:Nucleoporin NUP42 n=1 Tax=Aquatica leii TaxID=1421715 RepID=A0AAN7QDP4_9COLE|nr:hypothetical protein RN001_014133 [Aquatica leii]